MERSRSRQRKPTVAGDNTSVSSRKYRDTKEDRTMGSYTHAHTHTRTHTHTQTHTHNYKAKSDWHLIFIWKEVILQLSNTEKKKVMTSSVHPDATNIIKTKTEDEHDSVQRESDSK